MKGSPSAGPVIGGRTLLISLALFVVSITSCSYAENWPEAVPTEMMLDMPQLEYALGLAWNSSGTNLFFIGKEIEEPDRTFAYRYDITQHTIQRLDARPWMTSTEWIIKDGEEAVYGVGRYKDKRSIVRLNTKTETSQVVYEPQPGWVLARLVASASGDAIAALILKDGGEDELTAYYVIVLLRDEGFKERRIWGGENRFGNELHWAPNGKSLAWRGGKFDGTYQALHVVADVDNNNIFSLPENEVQQFGSWSPNSQELVYYNNQRAGPTQLRVWNLQTQQSRLLTTLADRAMIDYTLAHAAWSPNGKWIAYTMQFPQPTGSPHEELWIVSSDGRKNMRGAAHQLSNPERSRPHGGSFDSLTWSPDSKTIAFIRGKEIRVLRLESVVSKNSSGDKKEGTEGD